MKTPVVIGIAGGTGSGKTTIADQIRKQMGERIAFIPQDAYYRNFGEMNSPDWEHVNFDHPDAFDNQLLVDHLKTLKQDEPIEMPVYDFKTHTRKEETIRIEPAKIIVVEGILIFEYQPLLDVMDIKIFVDTDADIRILRRIERDIRERGRTLESVIQQYREFVRPMHLQFVEPTRRKADIIIPEGGWNRVGIDFIISKIHYLLHVRGASEKYHR